MRSVFYDSGKLVLKEGQSAPSAKTGEVLVRVRAYGVAVSDLHAYKTGMASSVYGKISAEVVQSTDNGFQAGDRVYICSDFNCRRCSYCTSGFQNLCSDRTDLLSANIAFSEYILLPRDYLEAGAAVKVAKNVGFDELTLLGPISNCLNTFRLIDLYFCDRVVVCGAGPMGLLHVALLKCLGAEEVIVVDVSKERLKRARDFGADYQIDASETDAAKEIVLLADGGADKVIVATASPSAMHDSVFMARATGVIAFFGGTALEKNQARFELDPNPVHYKQLKIVGAYSSSLRDYRLASNLLSEGRLRQINSLNTHRLDIGRLWEVFSICSDPSALRVVVEI